MNHKKKQKKNLQEATLTEESKRADAERAAEGEDEDHDNRKLKKPERMRMVLKNKEEGTEVSNNLHYIYNCKFKLKCIYMYTFILIVI